MYTVMKNVRKEIENVTETKENIKVRCKVEFGINSISDEICVFYGAKHMSFATIFKFSSGHESTIDVAYSGRKN